MALPHPFADPAAAPPFWANGPDPMGYHSFPNRSNGGPKTAVAGPNTHSQYPISTGTSVFGLRYKDGVIIAADNLGSYGSLARFPDLQRVFKINDTTVISASGDIADFQYLHSIIKSKQINEDIHGGGVTMRPEALHCWLTRVLYNRRSKYETKYIKMSSFC
jgi:20S proteasome subunit beta 7